ncbi:MAG: hypothetical protein OSJ54_13635, partial [Oscillospiraceae bacterium]|nr:hypothetical protein [Oscillospiraceae bacterium]
MNSKKTPISTVGASPKLPSLNNYAPVINPSVGGGLGVSPKVPSLDTSAIRKNMLDSSKVGVIGGGGVPGG